MKKLLLATIVAASAITSVKAQYNDDVMNRLLNRFRQIQQTHPLDLKRFKTEQAGSLDSLVQKELSPVLAMPSEDQKLMKAYTPGYKHKPGEMNLYPLWEEIPAPVPSLPEAKQTDIDGKYQSYIDKIEKLKEDFSKMQQEHLAQQQTGTAAVMEQAKTMASKNAVVQQMGGTDAVINMSEAERKKAAKNIAANVKNNPGAYTGLKDDGMNAMAQKMLNDPAYRERYNNMNDQEKQAELMKYMTNKTIKRDDKAFEQNMQERSKANTAAEIEQLMGRCLTRMQEAAAQINEGAALTQTFYSSLYQQINVWYQQEYEKLPIVVMGEMRERKGVGELDKAKAAVTYLIQQKEAVTRTILWSSLKLRTKLAFGEFNDFIGQFGWGKMRNANLIDGEYTEIQVAKGVHSLYEQMINMAKDASGITSTHKGQQEQFEFMIH